MAGTRCANPEYALEVDTLAVDYLLYKAIEAQLELLKILSEQAAFDKTSPSARVSAQAISCLRLVEMYDTWKALYDRNHGDTLSNGIRQDGKILQYLVSLTSWALGKAEHAADLLPKMSTEMQNRQRFEMSLDQSLRRCWLRAKKGIRPSGDHDEDGHWPLQEQALFSAGYLVPLFMRISADLFDRSKSPRLGHEWMTLATDLMVHASVEVFEIALSSRTDSSMVHSAVQDCFAWGGLHPSQLHSLREAVSDMSSEHIIYSQSTAFQEVTEVEEHCQNMFQRHYNPEDGMSQEVTASRRQEQSWEHVKQDPFHDVMMTFTSIQEAEAHTAHRPVEMLKQQYKISDLLSRMYDFILVHWSLLHSRAWNGKPKLLQIEEGYLDGLTPTQFEDFKRRAGIDRWDLATLQREDVSQDSE